MLAIAGLHVARVDRAGTSIPTVRSVDAHAQPQRASIVGAGDAVVAVRCAHASRRRVARIERAGDVVVAVHGRMFASFHGVARVHCAIVAIIAIDRRVLTTRGRVARVLRARIAVVASVGVRASAAWIADIGRAWVVVIADDRSMVASIAGDAGVRGTEIAVVAVDVRDAIGEGC